jgi:hypothetical protein
MKTIKYSSYAEIENELEILKLEKEIHYQKLVLSLQQTKESFTPQSLVGDFVSSYASSATIPYGTVIKTALPFVLQMVIPLVKKWFSKIKRGN